MLDDPEVALMFARKTTETVCKILYFDKISQHVPPPIGLEDLLAKLKHGKHLPPRLEIQFRTIQSHGNFGSHDQGDDSDEITADDVAPCVKSLDLVSKWLLEKYLSEDYRTIVVLPDSKPVTKQLLKGIPDKTLRFLLNVSESTSVDDARAAFETFAAGRDGDWRRLWSEFQAQWQKKSTPPTHSPKSSAALEALRKLAQRSAPGAS